MDHSRSWAIATVSALVVLVVLMPVTTACRGTEEVALVHSTIINQYFYGLDRGLIPSPGVSFDIQVIQDPAALGTFLVSRQQDADLVEAGPVVAATAHGRNENARIVGTLLEGREGIAVLVTRSDSTIRELSDLVNHVVGVNSLATTPTIVLRELLRQEHSVEYEEVSYLTRPQPLLLSDLENGDIDAALVFGVFAYRAVNSDGFRVVSDLYADSQQFLGDYPISIILASPNPERLDDETRTGALGAIHRSLQYSQKNKQEIADELSGELGLTSEEYEESFFGLSPTEVTLNEDDVQRILVLLRHAHRQGVLEREPQQDLFYGD